MYKYTGWKFVSLCYRVKGERWCILLYHPIFSFVLFYNNIIFCLHWNSSYLIMWKIKCSLIYSFCLLISWSLLICICVKVKLSYSDKLSFSSINDFLKLLSVLFEWWMLLVICGWFRVSKHNLLLFEII